MATVTVWITTYNHEAFIAQAIESVLMQQTEFDFELLIAEDCSSDRTRDIVREYGDRYPGKIRLFLPERNLGMAAMFRASFALCEGRYIAWLDGDDYWTDPFKLQKQADYLDANRDCVLSFHEVTYLDQVSGGCRSRAAMPRLPSCPMTALQFARHNPIDAPSVMHRNVLQGRLPEWFENLPFPDYALYFLLLEHGYAGYAEDDMAVYRIHNGGVWSGQDKYQNLRDVIRFYRKIRVFLPYLPGRAIRRGSARYALQMARLDWEHGRPVSLAADLAMIAANDPGLLLDCLKSFAIRRIRG